MDIKISLSHNDSLNMKNFINALSKQFYNVFGYEIHNHGSRDLLRACFDNGWRFDLTFIYPRQQETQATDISFFEKIDTVINQFWFLSSGVLIKLGRNDFLIAAHLVLELYQLNIVIQMLIRDEEKKTNIHRFGDEEDVPILHSLVPLKKHCNFPLETKVEILSLLFNAAEHMDKISTTICPGYAGRSGKLNMLYHQFNSSY